MTASSPSADAASSRPTVVEPLVARVARFGRFLTGALVDELAIVIS
jgi:hypothetical protein